VPFYCEDVGTYTARGSKLECEKVKGELKQESKSVTQSVECVEVIGSGITEEDPTVRMKQRSMPAVDHSTSLQCLPNATGSQSLLESASVRTHFNAHACARGVAQ
jgi:hypothetical protein